MKSIVMAEDILYKENRYNKLKIFFVLGFIIISFAPFTLSMGRFKNDFTNNKLNDNTPLNIKVAKAYGIDSFSKIKKIDYTFNVNFNGKVFKRKWEWYPETKDITYWGKDSSGKDENMSYNQNKNMDEKTKKIDAKFINDNYWLLFPFHLVWDKNVDFKDEGLKNYPVSKGRGRCLVITYSRKVGYTPGDVFELYLDKDYKIHEWVYKAGGSEKNPFSATWEGNKNFNGITISTEHYGPGKKFKLWFSDINVEYAK